MSTLPQELIDAIVRQLHGTSCLKSCSLAAPFFVAPSQRRLFRSWRIFSGTLNGTMTTDLDAAEAFIASCPQVASYIRHFTFNIPFSESDQYPLIPILRALTNVEHLHVNANRMLWQNLAEALQTALLDVIMQPRMTQLDLMYLDNIPQPLVMQIAASVAVLTFYCSTVDGSSGDTDVDNARLSTLRYLSLPGPGERLSSFCDVLLTTPAFAASLQRLHIRLGTRSATYEARILTAVAPTLHHLQLDIEARISSTNQPKSLPSLPPMPNLLRLDIVLSRTHIPHIPATLTSILAQIAAPFPRVEVINVHSTYVDEQPLLRHVHPSLHNHIFFPCLRRLNCTITPQLAWPRRREDENALRRDLVSAVQIALPSLRGIDGILSFKFMGWKPSAGSVRVQTTAPHPSSDLFYACALTNDFLKSPTFPRAAMAFLLNPHGATDHIPIIRHLLLPGSPVPLRPSDRLSLFLFALCGPIEVQLNGRSLEKFCTRKANKGAHLQTWLLDESDLGLSASRSQEDVLRLLLRWTARDSAPAGHPILLVISALMHFQRPFARAVSLTLLVPIMRAHLTAALQQHSELLRPRADLGVYQSELCDLLVQVIPRLVPLGGSMNWARTWLTHMLPPARRDPVAYPSVLINADFARQEECQRLAWRAGMFPHKATCYAIAALRTQLVEALPDIGPSRTGSPSEPTSSREEHMSRWMTPSRIKAIDEGDVDGTLCDAITLYLGLLLRAKGLVALAASNSIE
ncbi:hypothetical protein C8J57DRAFT_1718762 [Mycena rebaudengoi]|nr:hypothetical protein C8J57DRAFT_1718762 [Mycena rebaudengoi]